jgi:AcrR family transcriptional regulator
MRKEEVEASQRARLTRAMLELVADQGYEATSVIGVVTAARVSRGTFYAFFTDKTDCFLAACDEWVDEILGSLFALASEDDWIVALRTGLGVYLQYFQDRPVLTRAYFVELPTAGPRATEQRVKTYARFRSLFEALAGWARQAQPDLPPLAEGSLSAAVFAPTEMVAVEVREGRIDRLRDLEEELLRLLIRLLADDGTALREVPQ